MTDISEREACTKRCWWLGAGVGLLVAFLLLAFGIWGLLMSILAGVLVAVIVGYLAMTLLCKDVPAAAPQDNTRSAAAASVAGASTAEETPEQEPTAPVADTAAVEAAPEAVVEAEEAPVAVESPTQVVEAPAEPSEAEPAPVPATDSRSTDGKPALLEAPRAGGADDLKRIGGIGPKLEQTLNELGIYHFDQIAALQGDEIEWVDSRLRFKGRIQRDDWIGQAKALANDGKAGV